ncbi:MULTISPECIES: RusA family crossover junction endodeoxyribonuclease [unclassified Facklamia]|uniref:RusA family crossover junction endodeoxyribonuclease n=1 Tax=Aerococcaceae TaxID=186827 RepID=UPI0013B8EEEF|nr:MULTISPECIES: RusA family crossover junction endodeoxyribonuclease [unclassified Facklamia]NEW64279.1 RusA family crossover junction endodeoxyribonuclease [Facklamia sp. 252]NEW67884.1 RusA family crossover junction endodeoxyribonuclease [Facklamia sp. 253]QQD64745.1 RusA family crossover junction endodeoxyribonuclease [Aerococcaceae bacterium zg-252]
MDKLVIPGELMSLNEYISIERANRHLAAKAKKKQTNLCALYARSAKNSGLIISTPAKLKFTWYSKNKRKDADNIAFAKKFILDGMVKAKLIENDNQKHIIGFVDEFVLDKANPRVEIEVIGG